MVWPIKVACRVVTLGWGRVVGVSGLALRFVFGIWGCERMEVCRG